MLAVYSSLLMIAAIMASPSLPSSVPSSSGHIKIYPPAEPNYPPINPFRKSAPIPASDKAQSLLDAYALRFAKHSAENTIGLRTPIVRISSAMHPSNFHIPQPLSSSSSSSQNEHVHSGISTSTRLDQFAIANQQSDDALAFGAISNPTAFFLQGAHLDQIKKPKCELTECDGPVPNDGSIRFTMQRKPSKSCYQTFIPMNSCVADKGYPVGMVCTVCCECSASFVSEMQNSKGFKIGLKRK